MLLGIIPTVILIGPAAIASWLIPGLLASAAWVCRRWVIVLSVTSLASALFAVVEWFGPRLGRFAQSDCLWLSLAVLFWLGSFLAGGRAYRRDWPRPGFGTALGWVCCALIPLLCAGFLWHSGHSAWQTPIRELLVLAAIASTGSLLVLVSLSGSASLAGFHPLFWSRASEPLALAAGGILAVYFTGYETARWSGAGQRMPLETPARVDPTEPALLKPLIGWSYESDRRGLFVSSPLIVGDAVFVAGAHRAGLGQYGILYRLDRQTGEVRWQFDNQEQMKSAFSSPCFADGRIFIGEGFHDDRDCRVYAIDAASGRKLWQHTVASHTESSPAVADGRVVFGTGSNGLYCLEAATGKQLWHRPESHLDANPLIYKGKVYVGSWTRDNETMADLFCLDVVNGRVIWRTPVDLPAFAAPEPADDYVYFALGNGNFSEAADHPAGAVLCVQPHSGRVQWRFDVPNSVLGQPKRVDSLVVFGCRDGQCYAVHADSGKLVWQRKLGQSILASVAVLKHENAIAEVIVAGTQGRVEGLSAHDGRPIWEFDLAQQAQRPQAQIFSAPAVSSDHRVLIAGSTSNYLNWAAHLLELKLEPILASQQIVNSQQPASANPGQR